MTKHRALSVLYDEESNTTVEESVYFTADTTTMRVDVLGDALGLLQERYREAVQQAFTDKTGQFREGIAETMGHGQRVRDLLAPKHSN